MDENSHNVNCRKMIERLQRRGKYLELYALAGKVSQLRAAVLPGYATNKQVAWDITKGDGRASQINGW